MPFIHNMKLKYRVAGLVALALLTMRFGLGAGTGANASDITPQNVMSAVNLERTSRNIAALNYNSKLAAAAQYKSSDMIARNYFSHIDPDGHYIWDKITSEGYYPYSILGENLAINFPDTAGLMSAWMDSPEHRSNILNSQFQDQGVGVAFGNANAGQFEDAITNAFGAQPAPVQNRAAPPAPGTAPTAPPAHSQKAPSKTPAPSPAKSSAALTIKSQEQNHLTLKQTGSAPQAKIDLNSIRITAKVANSFLDLHVLVNVAGTPQTVNASIANDSIALTLQSDPPLEQTFGGDLLFSQYFNWQKQRMVITAQGANSAQDSATVPLANVKLAQGSQNPKDLGNFEAKIKNPDLYNVYKYTVIVFGILFILFFVVDSYREFKRKIRHFFFKGDSHIIVILLIISTLLIVNWWH